MTGVRTFLHLVRASIRARMQYKTSFLLTTLVLVDFAVVAAILYRYQALAGWDLYQVALLAGVAGAGFGLFRGLAGGLDTFETYLVTGDFDILTARPWPTLGALLTRGLDLPRLGAAVQGFVLLALAAGALVQRGDLTAWEVVYILLLPANAALILAAMALAVCAAGFWLVRIEDLLILGVNAPNSAGSYPMEIYPGWLRQFLTAVIPAAFIGYVPVRYLLGKGGDWTHLLWPYAVSALAWWLAYRLWRRGERHYQSAGG